MSADLMTLKRTGQTRAPSVPPPRSRWKTRVLLPTVVLAAVVGLLVYASWGVIAPAHRVAVAPVIVKASSGQAARAPEGAVVAQAAGWVEPDPFPTYVTALADGIVEDVLVLEGDRIEPGEVVAVLVREDAELELAQREADVAIAEANVASARADVVAAEEVLTTLVDRKASVVALEAAHAARVGEGKQLAAQVASGEAELASIEDELARKRGLVDSGAVSAGGIARLELARDAKAGAVDALRAKRDMVHAQAEEARARAEQAARQLELLTEEQRSAARARAALALSESSLAHARARRDAAALQLSRMEVRTSSGGVVMTRLVAPGSKVVRAGDTPHSAHIVHLYDPDQLQVRVDVPLADAALVGVGQRAQVIVEVLPDRTFEGRIVRVVHEADIQKNTLQVKVAIEDPATEIKPEMLARVKFLGGGGSGVGGGQAAQGATGKRTFVNELAVLGAGDGAGTALVVVDRRGARGRIEVRELTLGRAREGGYVEVRSGLMPGDQVVVDGGAGLEAGARVRVTEENE